MWGNMRGWDPHLSWGAWWRRSSQEWVIPSPLLLVTVRQMFTSGPGRQDKTQNIYFRLEIILLSRMLFSSAVWRVSRARGGGIVVMQDNTDTRDSHHLLRAISVCPTQPDTSSVVSEFVILTTSSQLSHSRERKYWKYWKIFYMSILLISRG